MRCVGLQQSLLRVRPMWGGEFRVGGSRAAGGLWIRRLAVAAVVVGVGLRAEVAAAQDDASKGDESEAPAAPAEGEAAKLEQAVKQLEQLEYTEAQQLLLEIIRSGKAGPEQLARAYFNLGIVEAALDNEVESTDSFYVALMLQPSLLFPEGGSPKIRARLNEARSRVTEVGVLEIRAGVKGGVLEVHIDNDPLKLIQRVAVTMTRAGGETGKVDLEKNELRAEVEPGVETIEVALYDESGNALRVLEVDPVAKSSSASKIAGGAASSSVWQSWGLWAGVAGALAIGGTYFIMESGDLGSEIDDAENEPEPDVAQIARLEDDKDRVGLYGIVGLSMAGAAAVTAGALILFSGDDDSGASVGKEASPEASLMPTFAPGHLGARLHLRF